VTFAGPPGTPGAGPAARCVINELDVDVPNTSWEHVDVDGQGAQRVVAEIRGGADGITWTNSAIGDNVNLAAVQLTARAATFDNMLFHDAVDDGTTPDVHMECVWAADVGGLVLRNSTFRNCAVFDIVFTYGDWWVPAAPAYNDVLIENNVFGCSRIANGRGYHPEGSLAIGSNGPALASEPLVNWRIRFNSICDARVANDNGDRVASGGSEWVGNVGGLACLDGFSYHHNVGVTCGGTSSVAASPDVYDGVAPEPTYWIDEPADDLGLPAGSPAIGAGDPADHPATDRNGVPRARPPDAGALEFTR
jgi:hypothetical protein